MSGQDECLRRRFFDLLGSDLQIYAVTPVPDRVTVLQMDRVPDCIKSFYRVNNVRRFRYDRPFHKGPKDRDNEFKVSWLDHAFSYKLISNLIVLVILFQSLWIERTTLILTHPLPGISRWLEVERRELVSQKKRNVISFRFLLFLLPG